MSQHVTHGLWVYAGAWNAGIIAHHTVLQVVCSDWVQEAELRSASHTSDGQLHASGTGIQRYQNGLVPDYEYYSKQHLIPDFDLKAHKPEKLSRGSVVMQDDALTCSETTLV